FADTLCHDSRLWFRVSCHCSLKRIGEHVRHDPRSFTAQMCVTNQVVGDSSGFGLAAQRRERVDEPDIQIGTHCSQVRTEVTGHPKSDGVIGVPDEAMKHAM